MTRFNMGSFRIHFFSGITAVAAFAILDWLLMWESSPLRSFALSHVDLQNLWRKIHAFPLIAGVFASGNIHQPSVIGYYAAAIVQWFALGFIVAIPFSRLSVRHAAS